MPRCSLKSQGISRTSEKKMERLNPCLKQAESFIGRGRRRRRRRRRRKRLDELRCYHLSALVQELVTSQRKILVYLRGTRISKFLAPSLALSVIICFDGAELFIPLGCLGQINLNRLKSLHVVIYTFLLLFLSSFQFMQSSYILIPILCYSLEFLQIFILFPSFFAPYNLSNVSQVFLILLMTPCKLYFLFPFLT